MEIRDHCEARAAECKVLVNEPAISNERAAALTTIANTWLILACLHERLAAIINKESQEDRLA
jgi:hypothetical protein